MLRNIFKVSIIVLVISALAVSAGLLFFEDEITNIWRNGDEIRDMRGADRGEVVITYGTPMTTLEPTSFAGTDRARLANIYEPLIRADKNFNIEPILAVSYGILEPNFWEFTIRDNVRFHDGSSLDANDVEKSIDRALNYENSQLRDLLETIKEVEVKNEKTIYIHTKEPDPLLLNKLSTVLIYPEELKNPEIQAIGTGPYILTGWKAGQKTSMELNPSYWGERPTFSKVVIKTIPKKEDRLNALKNNETDILVNVPPDSVGALEGQVQIETIPSLEVSYLMFNLKKGQNLVRDRRFREAVKYAVNSTKLINMTYGFARPVNQFVSNGVFGFNTRIKKTDMDIKTAGELVKKASPKDTPKITLDISKGLEVFGEALKGMLKNAGISLELNFLDWPDLNKKIEQGESDMYFLGWRSELGDAFDFLNSVAHSKGKFNGGAYRNQEVDKLIEESAHEMKTKDRLNKLQEVMRIITEEDVIGVPLIEAETVYAIQPGIRWEPRLDGLVLAKDIN